jgi:hypothetical protein
MPRMKNTLLAAMIVFASVGTASAGGLPNSIGVGFEAEISQAGGVSVNYDAGKFHAGGFLSFADPDGANNSRFEVGGRFFFHVASTASSDFGVGGGLGLRNTGNGANNNTSTSELFVEPSFQIRAFIVPNVALSFTAGFSLGTLDRHDVVLDGGLTGLAGIHYYF